MKVSIVTISAIAVLAMSSLSASSQENEKAAKARKDMIEAKKALTEAKIDSAADYEQFKKEAETSIAENQKKIAELKDKGSSLADDLKKKYDKKMKQLEVKNEDLQEQIDESVHTKTSKWAAFKREFKKDMGDVSDAIKNIGVNNHE